MQAKLADSRTEALAGRSMVMATAHNKDNGAEVVTDAACCKLFCSEMVGRVADRAVQNHGGAVYMAEYAVDVSIAMCGCSGSTKAHHKFSRSSSPAT